ncbi:MAG: SPOR domain-containing protein, partial [Alphaproteobacteria bacterium]|nr:SPOR domain-containing protein [Alphaproteobacteria bacterium]
SRDRHMRDILNKGFAAIKRKPTLVAALYRKKPAPRIKPTLLAKLEQDATDAAAKKDQLRREIMTAALVQPTIAPPADDRLGVLIAAADTDDFNEFERTRIAALDGGAEFVGEGDRQYVNEFSWTVQIGAYSTKQLAQEELEAAAIKGGLPNRTRAVIPASRADGTMLYRARFMNLSEIEAAAACAGLGDKGVSCFVAADVEPVSQ